MRISSTSDAILPEVIQLLGERAGMGSESLSAAALAHALQKRIACTQAATPQVYLQRLRSDEAEFQEVIEELIVPETWFFRDAMAFRCLRRQFEAARSTLRQVRVLSIGCSTGEEVYSLAMSLRDAGFMSTEYVLVGADISRRSLDFAREAIYPSRSFRATDDAAAASCQRWCERNSESWRVGDELRKGIQFVHGNLSQTGFLRSEPPFDFVVCRNVLIYFHEAARRIAVRNVQTLLGLRGLLLSAPAEARIFSEAGFHSLGSECPFAFHHSKDPVDLSAGVAAPSAPLLESMPGSRTRSKVPLLAPRSSPTDVRPRRSGLEVDAKEPSISAPSAGTGPDLSAAQRAADGGHLEEADDLCGRVLMRDPTNAEAHYLQGIVRTAQGALSEAQRSFKKALYLNSRHPQALVQMMLLAEQLGDRQSAANYRRRAEQATPEIK